MSRRAGPADLIEREAILLATSCAARRHAGAERLRGLLADCDEETLLGLLRRTRLTSLVGHRILCLAAPDTLPQITLAADGAALSARRRGAVQAAVQSAVLDRLTHAGIAAAALKGPDLAQRIHGDLGLRPCADVDVLVDPARLSDAVAVVRTLGYGGGPPTSAPWLAELHHRLEHPAGIMPLVELHWRAEWYSTLARSGGFARTALERSSPDPDGHGRRIQPADELGLLLLVLARDGLVGLRLPADVAAWWDRYGPDVPAGALQEIVDRDPALGTPLAVSARLCARLVGLPASDLLDLGPARTPRARLAVRLADPFLDMRSTRPVEALVDGLMSSRHSLWPFVRRRLLPPPGHIAVTYGPTTTSTGLLRLRLLQTQHPIRIVAHWVMCIVSPPPRPPLVGG